MARPSSIDLLTPELRELLNELLRDPAITQAEAVKRINALAESQGEDVRVSKSAVNRYSQRMEAVGAKIRQSREVADMWIGRLGNQPQGKVGSLMNEFIRQLAFEQLLDLQDGETPVEPKALANLALVIKRLEEASMINEKREAEIKKRATEEAAQAAADEAVAAGISEDTVAQIRAKILGIV